MDATALSPLTAWDSFYVIVGSSAAALTGLQFVVIVLGAEIGTLRDPAATRAFGSPTVVHLSAVLLLAALLTAPWHSLASAGVLITAGSVLGFIYVVRTVWHALRQTAYAPVLEDWLWHCLFPLIAYAALAVEGIILPHTPSTSLFVIGAMAIGLLFVGIHNAWDSVTYIALLQGKKKNAEKASKEQG